jgi:hypothetical protein
MSKLPVGQEVRISEADRKHGCFRGQKLKISRAAGTRAYIREQEVNLTSANPEVSFYTRGQ